MGCDVGLADSEIDVRRLLPDLFTQDETRFDLGKIDASAVTPGWNGKVSWPKIPVHWFVPAATNVTIDRLLGI